MQPQQSDPSELTTQQLLREVANLREVLDFRLEEMDRRYQERTNQQQLAVDVALGSANRAVGELEASISRRIEQLDRLTDSKFITHRTLLDSQAEKVALALAASDKAVNKAETATEKRFESVNEFRAQLTDQTKTFIPRSEFDATIKSMVEKIDDLKSYRDTSTGKGLGAAQLWGILLGAVGLIGAVIAILVGNN